MRKTTEARKIKITVHNILNICSMSQYQHDTVQVIQRARFALFQRDRLTRMEEKVTKTPRVHLQIVNTNKCMKRIVVCKNCLQYSSYNLMLLNCTNWAQKGEKKLFCRKGKLTSIYFYCYSKVKSNNNNDNNNKEGGVYVLPWLLPHFCCTKIILQNLSCQNISTKERIFFCFERPRQPLRLGCAAAQRKSCMLVIIFRRLKVKLGPVAAKSTPANRSQKENNLSAHETKLIRNDSVNPGSNVKHLCSRFSTQVGQIIWT